MYAREQEMLYVRNNYFFVSVVELSEISVSEKAFYPICLEELAVSEH
jgi:hypothetical protein